MPEHKSSNTVAGTLHSLGISDKNTRVTDISIEYGKGRIGFSFPSKEKQKYLLIDFDTAIIRCVKGIDPEDHNFSSESTVALIKLGTDGNFYEHHSEENRKDGRKEWELLEPEYFSAKSRS